LQEWLDPANPFDTGLTVEELVKQGHIMWADWLRQGYGATAADFFNTDTQASAWKNLVNASTGWTQPFKYDSATPEGRNERFLRDFAQSKYLSPDGDIPGGGKGQISAAMAIGGIRPGGSMFDKIKYNAFNTELQVYFDDQLLAPASEQIGIAAHFARLKGTPWYVGPEGTVGTDPTMAASVEATSTQGQAVPQAFAEDMVAKVGNQWKTKLKTEREDPFIPTTVGKLSQASLASAYRGIEKWPYSEEGSVQKELEEAERLRNKSVITRAGNFPTA
jgi:hypothetical protein